LSIGCPSLMLRSFGTSWKYMILTLTAECKQMIVNGLHSWGASTCRTCLQTISLALSFLCVIMSVLNDEKGVKYA